MAQQVHRPVYAKKKLFKRAKRTGDFSKYKRARNKTLGKLLSAKRRYFLRLNPKEPKKFWKAIKFLNKRVRSIPTLTQGSDVASSEIDKAAMLNNFFVKCFNTTFPPLPQTIAKPSFDLDLRRDVMHRERSSSSSVITRCC